MVAGNCQTNNSPPTQTRTHTHAATESQSFEQSDLFPMIRFDALFSYLFIYFTESISLMRASVCFKNPLCIWFSHSELLIFLWLWFDSIEFRCKSEWVAVTMDTTEDRKKCGDRHGGIGFQLMYQIYCHNHLIICDKSITTEIHAWAASRELWRLYYCYFVSFKTITQRYRTQINEQTWPTIYRKLKNARATNKRKLEKKYCKEKQLKRKRSRAKVKIESMIERTQSEIGNGLSQWKQKTTSCQMPNKIYICVCRYIYALRWAM